MRIRRKATHAGSWYSGDRDELARQVSTWTSDADRCLHREGITGSRCLGVIAPHAGFSYSGPTAAYAYCKMTSNKVERVFILGPSHHYGLDRCALTTFQEYATPICDLEVDRAAQLNLWEKDKSMFESMPQEVDEAEHSIELHLPFVAAVAKKKAENCGKLKIVPILVGSLSTEYELRMGKILAPLLQDEKNFFIISSDFCHWGERFSYTRYSKTDGKIYQSIEKMDRMGMRLIEKQDYDGFKTYLKKTRNTICGRHPIGVLLAALNSSTLSLTVLFTMYKQSSHCQDLYDSSVSYASAVVCSKD